DRQDRCFRDRDLEDHEHLKGDDDRGWDEANAAREEDIKEDQKDRGRDARESSWLAHLVRKLDQGFRPTAQSRIEKLCRTSDHAKRDEEGKSCRAVLLPGDRGKAVGIPSKRNTRQKKYGSQHLVAKSHGWTSIAEGTAG